MEHSLAHWFMKWGYEALTETRRHGVAGAREGVLNVWQTLFVVANQRLVEIVGNPGRPIYEPDWDVLVVLDACRVDLLAEVADEYEFLPDGGVGTFRSRGSKTPDWMARNFTTDYAEEMESTAYIAGNPYSRELERDRLALLDEVWRYAWDETLRTIPSQPITDRAIETWRRREDHGAERMVVHYMQPHGPFVEESLDIGIDPGTLPAKADEFGRGNGRLWGQAGYTISRERVWRAYRDNLRHVLDGVTILLENMDADRVVITADHGNAFGEWGMWGHPKDLLLPGVRLVPWVETTGHDTGEYEPSVEPPDEVDEGVAEERLRALGYR